MFVALPIWARGRTKHLFSKLDPSSCDFDPSGQQEREAHANNASILCVGDQRRNKAGSSPSIATEPVICDKRRTSSVLTR